MNDIVRDGGGRFVKGVSGNPKGKAKGVRNEITLMRLTLEKALREYIGNPANAEQLLAGIDRIIDIAVNSPDEKQAISAMKLLLEKVMPSMPPQVEQEAQEADKRLQIIIQTNPDAKVPIQVIEGEYEVIENGEIAERTADD
jgi:hypothetical protein